MQICATYKLYKYFGGHELPHYHDVMRVSWIGNITHVQMYDLQEGISSVYRTCALQAKEIYTPNLKAAFSFALVCVGYPLVN